MSNPYKATLGSSKESLNVSNIGVNAGLKILLYLGRAAEGVIWYYNQYWAAFS